MSDTVIITLIIAGVPLIIFLVAILVFKDRIQELTVSAREGSISLVLTPADREAALQSLAKAEANKAGFAAPRSLGTTADEKERVESRVSNLERKVNKSILWVDDFPSNNTYEVGIFEPLGIDVAQVRSNHEAYQALKESHFDLVITDIGRKDQITDGLDLVSTLSEQYPNLPTIVYTSSQGVLHKTEEAFERGAKGITDWPDELTRLVLENLA